MTKRSEAKYKIDRRMGQNIWGRPKSPVNRREYGPGQHGQRRKGKLSDFGVQLRAKQKLKGYYANISERQFHGIYVEAGRMKGDTGENLIGLLERRLDTVVYRAKFLATMFAAPQFVDHPHPNANSRRLHISSYTLKPGAAGEVKTSTNQLGGVTGLQLEAEDVAAAAVHLDVAVIDELAGGEHGGDELGAIHHGIEAALEQADQVFTGVALHPAGFHIDAVELALGNVGVVALQLLLGAQLHAEVGKLPLAPLSVLPGAIFAAVPTPLPP